MIQTKPNNTDVPEGDMVDAFAKLTLNESQQKEVAVKKSVM